MASSWSILISLRTAPPEMHPCPPYATLLRANLGTRVITHPTCPQNTPAQNHRSTEHYADIRREMKPFISCTKPQVNRA